MIHYASLERMTLIYNTAEHEKASLNAYSIKGRATEVLTVEELPR